MFIRQELKQRDIDAIEFVRYIDYSMQGFAKAVGTLGHPKPASVILQRAFRAFLAERGGLDLKKMVGV